MQGKEMITEPEEIKLASLIWNLLSAQPMKSTDLYASLGMFERRDIKRVLKRHNGETWISHRHVKLTKDGYRTTTTWRLI